MYRLLRHDGKPTTRKSEAARDDLGRYRFDLYFRVAGKARHHIKWFKDEREAAEWVALESGAGSFRLSWSAAADRFLEANPGLSADYKAQVKRACQLVAQACGEIIEGVTLAQWSAWVQAKAKARTGRTANKDAQNAMRVARWARSVGLVRNDGLRFENAPTAKHEAKKKRRPFTGKELRSYLGKLPPRIAMPAEFMALTGWRSGAMCRLIWADVKKNRVVSVTKYKREVHAVMDEALGGLLKRARNGKNAVGPVFRNATGGAWNPRSFGHAWDRALKAAGLPHRVPHELRHTFGTAAAAAGLSVDQIKAVMGHSSRQSAEVYIRMAEADQDKAAMVARKSIVSNLLHSRSKCADFDLQRGNRNESKSVEVEGGKACNG